MVVVAVAVAVDVWPLPVTGAQDMPRVRSHQDSDTHAKLLERHPSRERDKQRPTGSRHAELPPPKPWKRSKRRNAGTRPPSPRSRSRRNLAPGTRSPCSRRAAGNSQKA